MADLTRSQLVMIIASHGSSDRNLTLRGVDFTQLKAVLQEQVLSRLDHVNLNETAPFDEMNPSAENIARFVHDQVAEALPQACVRWVRVWESPDAWATYTPNQPRRD